MRRRIFVTSSLGLLAAAATLGLVGAFTGAGLRAQPAAAPAGPAGPPQGKWIRLAPLPQATGELRSARARRLIREWARLHEHELRANWKRVKALQPLRQIAPLE